LAQGSDYPTKEVSLVETQVSLVLIGAALALLVRQGGPALIARIRSARTNREIQDRLARYCTMQR
jgi:hypothetical protein